jgi:hypothetical protein
MKVQHQIHTSNNYLASGQESLQSSQNRGIDQYIYQHRLASHFDQADDSRDDIFLLQLSSNGTASLQKNRIRGKLYALEVFLFFVN